MNKPFWHTIVIGTLITMIWAVTYQIADARRGGFGGGHRTMSRGGPAMGGSFHRSSARPQGSFNRSMNRPQQGMNQTWGSRGSVGNRDIGDRSQLGTRTSDRTLSEEGRDKVQDRYDDRQEFRNDSKEYYNDRQEWYENAWRRGMYYSAARWASVGCNNVVYVNGIRYYDCGGVRYEQVYRGGEVTYIIVN
jgi:hypothetical protein